MRHRFTTEPLPVRRPLCDAPRAATISIARRPDVSHWRSDGYRVEKLLSGFRQTIFGGAGGAIARLVRLSQDGVHIIWPLDEINALGAAD